MDDTTSNEDLAPDSLEPGDDLPDELKSFVTDPKNVALPDEVDQSDQPSEGKDSDS